MQRYLALPSGVCGVQTPITAGLALYLGVNICKVGLIIVPTPRTGLGIERFKACEELPAGKAGWGVRNTILYQMEGPRQTQELGPSPVRRRGLKAAGLHPIPDASLSVFGEVAVPLAVSAA